MLMLYVEDNRMDADLVIRELARTAPGIEIEWVPTYGEALARLDHCTANNTYDLVLTDMKLPDGNGLGLIPYIRDRELPVSIVVITGVGSEETAVAALKAGANDYVVKGKDYLARLPILLENAHDRFHVEFARFARPLHVLYAEWDAAGIDLTRRHLVKYAPYISLDVVGTAQEVLHRIPGTGTISAADGHKADVLLLDFHLPGMSGLELLKELTETRRIDMPVIMVTGYGDEEIALQAMRLGATDYVVKNETYLYHLPVVIENAYYRAQAAREHKALKESEERFRQLFQQSDDALFLLEMETFEIIDANPAAHELFDLKLNGTNRFKPWASHLDPQDFARFINQIRIDDLSRGFQLDKATGFSKDGTRIFISIRGKILDMGNVFTVYCSIRDITEKIQLTEEIRSTQAKLIQTNKMTSLGLLVASVAHEINNPNTYIATNAGILARAWQDASRIIQDQQKDNGDFPLGGITSTEMAELAPRLFHGIIDGSRRITEIIKNMREFVKTEKSHPDDLIEINPMIQASLSILWHHIHKYTDDFRLELHDSLPPARGCRQQIEQVIINLLMNALQSLQDKSRSVIVRTACDNASGTLLISVQDEGKGMDIDVLEHLTEPFFTTRLNEGGTGLGLFISASIIKEHGGMLEFDSEPGKGTLATIRLPAAKGLNNPGHYHEN